jgi:flavin reductase (DIM6/NTAB) family NADH-FMN oxidoreductase RutF
MILEPDKRNQVLPLPVEMADEVMICARNFPPEVDEFEMAGLKARPSAKIKPPGIDGCLAWMECTLEEEILRDKYALIIGKVVHLEIDDAVMDEKGRDKPGEGQGSCLRK